MAPIAVTSGAMLGLAVGASSAQASPYSVSQLGNLNVTGADSDPSDLTDVDGTLFYTADSRQLATQADPYGESLWSTSAPNTQPTLAAPVEADNLTNADGRLFFDSFVNDGDEQVWTSGGTSSTTVALSTSDGYYGGEYQLTPVGRDVYWFRDSTEGTELWKSDGTVANTGSTGVEADGNSLTAAGTELYFLADGNTAATDNTDELWQTNGTTAGTTQLTDFTETTDNGYSVDPSISGLTNAGGTLYFEANGANGPQEWMVANGEPEQVTSLANATGISQPTADGTELFFAVGNGNGEALWVANGSQASQLGTISSDDYEYTGSFANVDGTLYFEGPARSGFTLWKSNGTAAGTTAVGGPEDPRQLINADGTLDFVADGGIWTSNGTAATTRLIENSGPYPEDLTNAGAAPYFEASGQTTGEHLWGLNGSNAVEVDANINAGDTQGSYPHSFTSIGSGVFFATDYSSLWFDGTNGLTNLDSGSLGGEADQLTNVNGELYFDADNQIWQSNGSPAGTRATGISFSSSNSADLERLANVDGALYFVTQDRTSNGSDGTGLWTTNGTQSGTAELASFPDEGSYYESTDAIANAGATAYFVVPSSNGGALWSSNGTAAGTQPIFNSAGGDQISALTDVGSDVYFTSSGESGGSYAAQLWVSNGTTAGTISLGSVDDSYAGITNVGGTAFFVSNGELWSSNGVPAGTQEVTGDIDPYDLVNVSDELFFAGYQGDETGIFESNGTTAGTVFVDAPDPNSYMGDPDDLTNANGVLAFSASDGVHGEELWTSNGTAAGTGMVSDIWPGPGSGLGYQSYGPLTSVGSSLYFAADDGVDGVEPWVATGFAVNAPSSPGTGGGSGSGSGSSGTPNSGSGGSSSASGSGSSGTGSSSSGSGRSGSGSNGAGAGAGGGGAKPASRGVVQLRKLVTSGPSVVLTLSCPAGRSACSVQGSLLAVETIAGPRVLAIGAEKSRVKKRRKTLTLSSGSASVPSGKTKVLTLKLDHQGQVLLGQHHSLALEAVVRENGRVVVSRVVKLKAKPARR